MKSMNILLDDRLCPKISDFGMAKEKLTSSIMTQSVAGTFAWMAPEVMMGQPHNEKIDIYGFGMVLWEMVTNQLPFSGMNHLALITAVAFQKQHPPLPPVSPQNTQELLSLIEGCWDHDPTKRKSLDEILSILLEIEKSITQSSSTDNSNTQLIPVDPASPEFVRLVDSFNASMQQHHDDYVISRIKSGLKPVSIPSCRLIK